MSVYRPTVTFLPAQAVPYGQIQKIKLFYFFPNTARSESRWGFFFFILFAPQPALFHLRAQISFHFAGIMKFHLFFHYVSCVCLCAYSASTCLWAFKMLEQTILLICSAYWACAIRFALKRRCLKRVTVGTDCFWSSAFFSSFYPWVNYNFS